MPTQDRPTTTPSTTPRNAASDAAPTAATHGSEVYIRPARPAEADDLTRIALASKRHWGYPEAWMALWRHELTFTPEIVARGGIFVAIQGASPQGLVAVRCRGRWAEIEHLWIAPAAMGRGLGRQLFTHAVAQARQDGAQMLEVVADPQAEGFYVRMGAKRVDTVASEPPGRRLPRLHMAIDAPTC